jgi:hypothetical protein
MWSACPVSFFPPDPPEDETEPDEQAAAPWWKPSAHELPALLPINETIASTATVVLTLTLARVYSNGVEFVVDRRARRGDRSRREWQELETHIHGHFSFRHPERLRYGMVLGDGEQLFADVPHAMFGVASEGHSLMQTGGGGEGGGGFYRYEDDLWLWPLPPEGPVELVVEWPALDVPESHVVLDGSPLRDLAADVRRVWD